MSSFIWPPQAGSGGGVTSINADSTAAQLLTVGTAGTNFAIVDAGAGSHVFNLPTASASNRGALSSADWSTFNSKQSALTLGDLTDVGTDGITVTGGVGAVVGSGASLSQHVADTTHNGYLSSTDWNTFNGKQSALTIGNLTDTGTDGITVTGGTGSVIGTGTSIAQHVADSTHNGYLLSTDWSTFNGKQASGNYITALTSDVTASGPGSVAATIAASAVTNAKMANMASSSSTVGTVKGNISGSAAAPSDIVLTSANTASSAVYRDGSGNFSAGTVTAALTGTASGNTTYSANNHGVVLSSGTNAMTVIAPNASTAFPLVSGGASADPSWAGLTVAGGGTGMTSATAFAVLCGGTTSTAAHQSVAALGASGTVLMSNGAGALPSFQAQAAAPRSQIYLDTSSAYGSSNTAVVRFTNAQINTGSGLTLTQSATNGDSITVNQVCVVSIEAQMICGTSSSYSLAITINGSALTSATPTFAQGKRSSSNPANTSKSARCAYTYVAALNDVIRVQSNAGTAEMNNADTILNVTVVSG